MQEDNLLYRQEVYGIQGAIFEVYRQMGCGFLEAVYQECLQREFLRRSIPFVSQPEVRLTYHGEVLTQIYRPDFICHGKVLLELKAVQDIAPAHKAQLLNYLKATGIRLGLIVNFGHFPEVEILRFVR